MVNSGHLGPSDAHVHGTIVTINKLSWRRWRWMVDDLSDRHGSYHGVAETRSKAEAAAGAVVRRLGPARERRVA
jgi:hypothetical protein